MVVGTVFGGLAIITNVTRDTTLVFVVVDASFPMAAVWEDVDPQLRAIEDRDHAEFALATEKDFVHSWQPELRLGSINPFAPCTFEGIETHPEAGLADERILITTASSCDTSPLIDWQIVLLQP